MAGVQPARDDVRAESIADWMERRRREVAGRGPEAELAGRTAWAARGGSGELPYAPRPSDVVTLGARTLQQGEDSARGYPAVSTSTTVAASRARQPTSWAPATAQVRPVAYRATSAATSPAPTDKPPQRPAQEDEMAKLRREQAAFKEVVREESRRNSWMAIPALAPAAAVLAAEGAGLLAARIAGPQVARAPLSFLEREAGLAAKPPAQALSTAEKQAIREAGRETLARANGISAAEMKAEVHHSRPLEWAHLFPKADPNALANLWGLRQAAHAIATSEWAAFRAALKGRIPTQAEIMAAKLRIDRMVEAYIRRAGVPRSEQAA